MAGLPEVIGLLYRSDWTRLSLSAELRSETDREPLPSLPREERTGWFRAWPGQRQDNGRYVGPGALLIGPGGRWRLECPVPGRGAEGEAAEGNDGERGWSWRPPEDRRASAGPGQGGRRLSRRRPSCSARPACSAGSPWKCWGR